MHLIIARLMEENERKKKMKKQNQRRAKTDPKASECYIALNYGTIHLQLQNAVNRRDLDSLMRAIGHLTERLNGSGLSIHQKPQIGELVADLMKPLGLTMMHLGLTAFDAGNLIKQILELSLDPTMQENEPQYYISPHLVHDFRRHPDMISAELPDMISKVLSLAPGPVKQIQLIDNGGKFAKDIPGNAASGITIKLHVDTLDNEHLMVTHVEALPGDPATAN